MVDHLTPEQRSRNMSLVPNRNTTPELVVRRIVHQLGFRFRLHRRDLPGSPDLVFPRLRRVIFVHGCFWHRHPNCHRAASTKTRRAYWEAKFARNVARDLEATSALEQAGWHVLVVWECETKDKAVIRRVARRFLRR